MLVSRPAAFILLFTKLLLMINTHIAIKTDLIFKAQRICKNKSRRNKRKSLVT